METTETTETTRLELPRRIALSFRFPPEDLREITELAQKHGMNRTAYIIAASLGRLEDPGLINKRFQAITDRLERLERLTYGE